MHEQREAEEGHKCEMGDGDTSTIKSIDLEEIKTNFDEIKHVNDMNEEEKLANDKIFKTKAAQNIIKCMF